MNAVGLHQALGEQLTTQTPQPARSRRAAAGRPPGPGLKTETADITWDAWEKPALFCRAGSVPDAWRNKEMRGRPTDSNSLPADQRATVLGGVLSASGRKVVYTLASMSSPVPLLGCSDHEPTTRCLTD